MRLLSLCTLLLVLSACGLKGDLVIPEPDAETSESSNAEQ